jgi:hypothetical protein
MDVTRVCNWCICVTDDGQLAAPLVVSLLSIVVHIHIKCMTKVVKALEGIIPLKAPVPPMLSDAIGYTGKERFVAFQWTPYGDEVEFADGRIIATGNWHLNETDFAGYVSLGSLCGVDVREILLKIQRRTEKK